MAESVPLYVGSQQDKQDFVSSEQTRLMSCHLCSVANTAVIPAKAGIQKHRSSSKILDSRLRGNNECPIRYFTHDTTLIGLIVNFDKRKVRDFDEDLQDEF
jgi:hypothetical protein